MSERQRPAYAHLFWWFFALGNGGLVAALFLPVHILLQGILGPLGVVPVVDQHYDTFATALANPIVKLYLFVVISMPIFLWAHRLRFQLLDLGLHGGQRLLEYVLYGLAGLIALIAAYLLATLP